VITRREFLAASFLAPAFVRQNPEARLVGVVPLGNPAGLPPAPLGRLVGSGLDARLFTDLSTLDAGGRDSLVTSNDRFYVRTAAPAGVRSTHGWTIPIGGLVESPVDVNLETLERLAIRRGPFLMECAGNADPSNFGLMSTATWDGAPIAAVLNRVRPSTREYRILVTGVDDPGPSRTSVPGASWIFSKDDLDGALLAIRMNGEPLPRDHGSPVRLVLPGWYGCACIKWVNRVELVADEAPPTTQMREFAGRTHQQGDSRLARDWTPAIIDTAAIPVRVEKWVAGGGVTYRVVGIIWGGTKPTNALSIRFRSSEAWTRVDDCPLPASTLMWSVWTHSWRPTEPGRYQIVLRVDDPAIRTRRLDLFFYTREVDVDEV
jgi:DMSO/TMAO reductase YedYZ molybdopterin-dependent catalytic subunit